MAFIKNNMKLVEGNYLLPYVYPFSKNFGHFVFLRHCWFTWWRKI